jgi:hypothetical protein
VDGRAAPVAGAEIAFDVLRCGDRWVGNGRWEYHAVDIRGVAIAPEGLRLQRVAVLPPP